MSKEFPCRVCPLPNMQFKKMLQKYVIYDKIK